MRPFGAFASRVSRAFFAPSASWSSSFLASAVPAYSSNSTARITLSGSPDGLSSCSSSASNCRFTSNDGAFFSTWRRPLGLLVGPGQLGSGLLPGGEVVRIEGGQVLFDEAAFRSLWQT
jgi:hypothetical protein